MVFGRIYSIRSYQTSDIYIGSTTQILCKRMTNHRTMYQTKKDVSSIEILKYDDAYIELIEEGEFESKQALRKREGHFIREMNCVNKRVAGRTHEEYYNEKGREYQAQYQEEYQKNYYETNAENIIEKQKIYNQKNKEKIKEYQKNYKMKQKMKQNEKE